VQRRRFVGRVAVDWVAVRYACRGREREKMCFSSWLAEYGGEGRERRGRRADYEMDGTVLTCRLHQSRLALLPVAVLHHLEEKGVRLGGVARAGPTDLGDA